MMEQIIGGVGLILIIIGTFLISEGRKIERHKVYPFLFIGGIFLLVYSIHIGDIIFIILQISYTLIVAYNIFKLKTSDQNNLKTKKR